MDKTVSVLCLVSVFCALVLNLTPEGKERRVMSFICSVVLLAALFQNIREPDWELYALERAELRQREESFLENAGEMRSELQRVVMEEECGTYILNRAHQMQIPLDAAAVTAQWEMEGLWIPYSAVLIGEVGEEERGRLSAVLEAELGIPRSRQEWRADGA